MFKTDHGFSTPVLNIIHKTPLLNQNVKLYRVWLTKKNIFFSIFFQVEVLRNVGIIISVGMCGILRILSISLYIKWICCCGHNTLLCRSLKYYRTHAYHLSSYFSPHSNFSNTTTKINCSVCINEKKETKRNNRL